MPVSFKVRPCLVMCVAFVIKKKVFRAFGPIVFFSEHAFAIAGKVPLSQYVKLFAKKKKRRGDSSTGSGQTWLVFLSEAKLVFEKPPRAREGSLQNHRESACYLPTNVILKNPFGGEHRPDPSLGLCRETDVSI